MMMLIIVLLLSSGYAIRTDVFVPPLTVDEAGFGRIDGRSEENAAIDNRIGDVRDE